MYTSCGWFFDELSGIETVQVIQYAARAIQLAGDLFNENLEPGYLDLLAKARSNLNEHGDGRQVYEKFARPAIATREKVAAHYAVDSLFESYGETARIYSFSVRQLDRQMLTSGHARLAIGRIQITFEMTGSSATISYAALHLGDQNLSCAVRSDGSEEDHATLLKEARESFDRGDFSDIVRLMDRHFGDTRYSLKSLFRDEQRRVLDKILAATRDEIHSSYRMITDRHAPLIRFLADLQVRPPKMLKLAAEMVFNSELRRLFDAEILDVERVRGMLKECEASQVPLEHDALGYAVKRHFDRLADLLLKEPGNQELLRRFTEAADVARELPFEVNLWKPQNSYYRLLQTALPQARARQDDANGESKAWIAKFLALGRRLGFQVDENPEGAVNPPPSPADSQKSKP
jgi:hypothetical protein